MINNYNARMDSKPVHKTQVWTSDSARTTNDPRKNAEGYLDLTAYEAIKKLEDESRVNERFNKCIHTIFHVCELAGFTLEGRVKMVDRITGKVFE